MPKQRARKKTKKDDRPRELVRSGELCLAFANSGAHRPDHRVRVSPPPPGTAPVPFASYDDLLAWGLRMGVLAEAGADAEALRRAAAARPVEAAAVVTLASELRGALLRAFTALATRHQPMAKDLDRLNESLAAIPARQVIGDVGGGFRWTWGGGDALARILAPIASSAGDLLVSEELRWLKRCAGRDCTWLFLDRKSRRRLYCDPNRCGSRASSRRDYKRMGRRW